MLRPRFLGSLLTALRRYYVILQLVKKVRDFFASAAIAAFTDRPLYDSLTILYMVYARQRKAMTASRTFRYGKEVYYIIYNSIKPRGNTSAGCHGGLSPHTARLLRQTQKSPLFRPKANHGGATVENLCNGGVTLGSPPGRAVAAGD